MTHTTRIITRTFLQADRLPPPPPHPCLEAIHKCRQRKSERVIYYFLFFFSLFICIVQSQLLIRVTGHKGHIQDMVVIYNLNE